MLLFTCRTCAVSASLSTASVNSPWLLTSEGDGAHADIEVRIGGRARVLPHVQTGLTGEFGEDPGARAAGLNMYPASLSRFDEVFWLCQWVRNH